jgi:hypothetical protein
MTDPTSTPALSACKPGRLWLVLHPLTLGLIATLVASPLPEALYSQEPDLNDRLGILATCFVLLGLWALWDKLRGRRRSARVTVSIMGLLAWLEALHCVLRSVYAHHGATGVGGLVAALLVLTLVADWWLSGVYVLLLTRAAARTPSAAPVDPPQA